MSEEVKKQTTAFGEQLVLSLYRMLKVIKIHWSNNQLLIKNIADFKEALSKICVDVDNANLRVYQGRFYLNGERIIFRASLLGIAGQMIDYLVKRNIQGIRFFEKEEIANEEIVVFINNLNKAEKQKDPLAWLQVQLDVDNCTWIELLVDQEFYVPVAELEVVEDTSQKAGSMTMTSIARRAYSQALTSIQSMTGKLTLRKQVGIQKAKRVIQSMIDILVEDENILLGMSTIRDYDDYTFTHSVNVSILSMCLGKRLGLSRSSIEQVGLCGLFHDLGKIDIPIDLINKRGLLTDEEFDLVKKHSMFSVRHIIRMNADRALKSRLLLPPLEHHQGIDHSGYPQTERTEELSLLGRVIAVADYYDAVTSSRSYRPDPISPDMALKMMSEASGTSLDAVVLKVFIDMIGVYPVGTLVVMDSREVGLVVETPKNAEMGCPIVCLLHMDDDEKLRRGDFVNLSERNENTGEFKRGIIKCFHPSEYGIQPANFLV